MKEIDFDTKTNTWERKKKLETSLRGTRKDIRTNEEGIKRLKTGLESLKTEIEEEVNWKMKPDVENTRRRINRSIREIEDILEEKTPMASNLDMGNNRLLNLPPPGDPKESTENYIDPVIVNMYMASWRRTGKRWMKDIWK